MGARRFHIEAADGTDPGRRRPRNEDAVIVFPEIGLYAVADGVSTRPRGNMASECALEHVSAFLGADRTWPMEAEGRRDDVRAHFVAAVEYANEALHREAAAWAKGRGPATTFAGLLVDEERACLAHVGDSRGYRLRDGTFEALTEDDSYANEFIRRGVPREEAHTMENANVLTCALGLSATVDVTARVEVLRAGDVFLACTDGLHGVVPVDEIAGILVENADVNVAAAKLIERANEFGGPDNVSVVLVRVELSDAARR
jgi:serine/threonine protein phosphatase PrpC